MKRVPILRREFSIGSKGAFSVDRDRLATVVSMKFFRPVCERQAAYRCDYEIALDRKIVRRFYGFGVDEITAALSAMRTAVSDIENRWAHEWRIAIPKEYFEDMRGASSSSRRRR